MKMKRVVAAVALVFGWAAWAQAEVFEFQQGENDYEGGQDLTIYDDDQVGPPAAGSIIIRAKYPQGNELYNTLIRFEGLEDVLAGMAIESAKLELIFGVDNQQAYVPAIIETYSAGKKWHDPNATWYEANGGLPWEVDGAQGATDRLLLHSETPMPRSSTDLYQDGEKFVFELNTDEVKNWVDNPNSNNGLLLVMDSDVAKTRVIFYSNESTVEEGSYRPLLRVTAFSCLPIPGDINFDCYVNTLDLKQMVDEWLETENLTADISEDGTVNLEDVAYLGRYWLECSKPGDPSCDWTGP